MTKEQLRAFREFKETLEKGFGEKNFFLKSNKKKLDYTIYLMLYKEPRTARVRVGFEQENGKIVAITLTWLDKKLEGKPQTSRFAFEE